MVDGLQMWFRPEYFGGVKDGTVEMYIDAQDEKLADLHIDLWACERDLAIEGDLSGDVFAGLDGIVDEFFKERGLEMQVSTLICRDIKHSDQWALFGQVAQVL